MSPMELIATITVCGWAAIVLWLLWRTLGWLARGMGCSRAKAAAWLALGAWLLGK